MPRGASPCGCAVEHAVLGGRQPVSGGLSYRLGVHLEDRSRQPVPKVVQGRPTGLDTVAEPSQCITVSNVACPLCWRQVALVGLVQGDFEHEFWVMGQGSDSKVTRLQAGSIQSVDECVNDACGVIDVQRGSPLLPPQRARRRGGGSEAAFLVTEFRLPSSSWPPCLTTNKSVAHHVRFAKT